VKTQELRLLVFLTRYIDLFTTFYSPYNSFMKVVYIISTATIIGVIKYVDPIKSLYNAEQDSFPHWKLCVIPCAILATSTRLFGNTMMAEILWTFSVYLESVSILPQLIVLHKYRLVENLTGKFIFFLGMYRFFYIMNWIYRANTERNYRHHPVLYIGGVVQFLLYVDFFYQYCRISRFCGFSRGKCLQRSYDAEDGSNIDEEDEDEDNDTDLIFELSGGTSENCRRVNNADAAATSDATEPLILDFSEEIQ
jgi:ER lumen protein retaining receptor